ncbi:protein ninH, partial [Hafnia alvei]|nr:protein ninH [Hafnia alvei]
MLVDTYGNQSELARR